MSWGLRGRGGGCGGEGVVEDVRALELIDREGPLKGLGIRSALGRGSAFVLLLRDRRTALGHVCSQSIFSDLHLDPSQSA